MVCVKAEDNKQTHQKPADNFPTAINNKDIIKEMTDWNSRQCDRQAMNPQAGCPCLDPLIMSQRGTISNWLVNIRSCGTSYQAPYGMYYKIMRSDYVLLH